MWWRMYFWFSDLALDLAWFGLDFGLGIGLGITKQDWTGHGMQLPWNGMARRFTFSGLVEVEVVFAIGNKWLGRDGME